MFCGVQNKPVLTEAGVDITKGSTFEQALFSDVLTSAVKPCKETHHLAHEEVCNLISVCTLRCVHIWCKGEQRDPLFGMIDRPIYNHPFVVSIRCLHISILIICSLAWEYGIAVNEVAVHSHLIVPLMLPCHGGAGIEIKGHG